MSELFNLMKKINLSQEKAMCNKFAELKKIYCWRHTNGEIFFFLRQFLRIDQDQNSEIYRQEKSGLIHFEILHLIMKTNIPLRLKNNVCNHSLSPAIAHNPKETLT